MIFHLMRRLRSVFQRAEPSGRFVAAAGVLLGISLVFTVLLKLAEGIDWTESAWQVWQTATTVGYGNRPAETPLGRLVTVLAGTMGIAFVGVCISGAFDLKRCFADRRRYGMSDNPVKGGYVLFHDPGPEILEVFVSEIRTAEPEAGICLVDPRLEQLPTALTSRFPNLHFIRGDVLDRRTFERARLKENKIAVVFPMDPLAPSSDGTTKTLVDLIGRFTGGKMRTVHVLVNPENAWMFEASAVSVWKHLEVLALVQECQDPHSSQVFSTLLSNRQGADPKSVVPEALVGWSWGDLVEASVRVARESGRPAHPLAVVRADGAVESCPAADLRIAEGDRLVMVVPPGFEWPRYQERIAATRKE